MSLSLYLYAQFHTILDAGFLYAPYWLGVARGPSGADNQTCLKRLHLLSRTRVHAGRLQSGIFKFCCIFVGF